jgi:DNA-binding transcriptional LysR family regulator
MFDWDKLRVFYTVAQAQSLTKAGDLLNLSQSAVSRQVSALEEQLNVTLFHRHARGLILTEQGEILFRTVAEMSHKLKTAENALMDSRERPRGPLIVTAPVAMGTMWLIPHLAEFHEIYPEITVSLVVADSELDVAMREADCAVRLYPSTHPDVVQRKITTLTCRLYASNDYLRRRGVPKRPEDLGGHQMIAYGEEQRPPFADVDWMLRVGAPEGESWRPAFKVNSVFGMLRAAEFGLGITGLPDYLLRDAKDVSPVLKEIKGPSLDVYFIYPTELRNSKRITVFRDFLLRKLSEKPF